MLTELFETLLRAVYFILPAYVANMLPVVFSKTTFLSSLKVPVDGGRLLAGQPLFGKNKTVRGFALGISGAICVVLIQKKLDSLFVFWSLSIFDYGAARITTVILLGVLLGFGALFGDLVKSFVKRRMGIAPGRPFVPWDQLDYIIGALLLSLPLFFPPFAIIITLLIASPIFHLLVNMIGYALGLKDVWW